MFELYQEFISCYLTFTYSGFFQFSSRILFEKSFILQQQEEVKQAANNNQVLLVHNNGNRSYEETLVKPPKAPSMESSHANTLMSSFKPEQSLSPSPPGIPTPDYDTMTTTAGNSPEPKDIDRKVRFQI